MASGSSKKTIKYWDLETFKLINRVPYSQSMPQVIDFYDPEDESPVEWLLAGFKDCVRCFNVEQNETGETIPLPDKDVQLQDMTINLKNHSIMTLGSKGSKLYMYSSPIPEMETFGEDDDEIEEDIQGDVEM